MNLNRLVRGLAGGLLALILGACSLGGSEGGIALPGATETLPAPGISVQGPPDPEGTAQTYLDAWTQGNYEGMYSLLSPLSQDAISQADFVDFHERMMLEATVRAVETRILQSLQNDLSAQVQYAVVLDTMLGGRINRETSMSMRFQNGRWGIDWVRSMIVPELGTENAFFMAYKIPSRGIIYDRNGLALAARGDAVAIGIVPGQIDPETEQDMLDEVSALIDLHPEIIQGLYQFQQPDWYVPVGIASADDVATRYDVLASYPALRLSSFQTRFYQAGPLGAPHAVGYTAFIQPDFVQSYRERGYRGDERVGALGIESWGEQYLIGKYGGTLYVVSAQGDILATLADGASEVAYNVTTTLDREFQHQVQIALQDLPGAVVVMDYNTGEILAMASGPSFDPNLFEPANPNTVQLGQVLANPYSPLVNRATQGLYPPGSTFKVVTMAAALESGLVAADTSYYCGYVWDELGPNALRYDWTYTREDEPESGELTLVGGLMRSCNPWFYHLGLLMFEYDPFYLAEFTERFGFGRLTGVVGLPESSNEEVAGQVPTEAWLTANGRAWQVGDNVNIAIGQGDLLVTPLQVAVAYSALANGGTLYEPQLIREVAAPGQPPIMTFDPVVTGNLELSPATYEAIEAGMLAVVRNERGTARRVFVGLDIPVYAKSGTAQSGQALPHAWFAGYTRANVPDRPDIVIVVLVENSGEGSDWGAPIFRRVVESYFYGRPRTLYPWEADFGLPRDQVIEDEEATATP